MVRFRVFSFLMSLLVMALLTTSSLAQDSTRADFEELRDLLKGRWVGDVIWVADWPGFGKRGDKVTAYFERKIAADGNALVSRYFGGQGSASTILTYDAGAKQIKELVATSGGTVWNNIFYKKDGKWFQQAVGSNPDGTKLEGQFTLNISDDGNTHRWRGTGTIGGKEADEIKDVWRRVAE